MDTSQSAHSFRGSQRLLTILPIGSCEQHGPYLPIDTDLRVSELLAKNIQASLSDIQTLLLPALPFSASWEHKGLGTIALNVRTLSAILHDIAKSLKAWNVPVLLLLVNWHGGNDLLASLATEISALEEIPTAVAPSIAQVGKAWDQSHITTAKDVHAGAVELSVLQAYWPEIVPEHLLESTHFEPQIAPAKVQAVLQALGFTAVTRDGIWGAPEQADAEKGKLLIEQLVHVVDQQVRALYDLIETYANKERE